MIETIEKFEIRAHAFRAMTGVTAPGKSIASAECCSDSDEYRFNAWEEWMKKYGACIGAIFLATEDILNLKDDD